MGVVYRAEQTAPIRREVAIKLIRYGMDSARVVARFESERQALAMMEHPNIARVFDAGATADGRPYFVMELVRGEPVTDFCDPGATPLTDRLRLFLQICDAVQHAHQKGIIHRDIKPSNVLVTRSGAEIVPKIIDFGIAKAVGESTAIAGSTLEGQVLGTPEYMSPGTGGRHRDWCRRYENRRLFARRALVRAGERQAAVRPEEPDAGRHRSCIAHAAETAERDRRASRMVRRAGRASRRDIDAVALMAIERDPTDRYGSVEQLADDVRRAIESGRSARGRRRGRTAAAGSSGGTRSPRRRSPAFALLVASSVVAVIRERNSRPRRRKRRPWSKRRARTPKPRRRRRCRDS